MWGPAHLGADRIIRERDLLTLAEACGRRRPGDRSSPTVPVSPHGPYPRGPSTYMSMGERSLRIVPLSTPRRETGADVARGMSPGHDPGLWGPR